MLSLKGVTGSILGQVIKIPRAVWHSQKKKNGASGNFMLYVFTSIKIIALQELLLPFLEREN